MQQFENFQTANIQTGRNLKIFEPQKSLQNIHFAGFPFFYNNLDYTFKAFNGRFKDF